MGNSSANDGMNVIAYNFSITIESDTQLDMNWSGDTSGNTGGNTSGDTGGDTGGNTGGDNEDTGLGGRGVDDDDDGGIDYEPPK